MQEGKKVEKRSTSRKERREERTKERKKEKEEREEEEKNKGGKAKRKEEGRKNEKESLGNKKKDKSKKAKRKWECEDGREGQKEKAADTEEERAGDQLWRLSPRMIWFAAVACVFIGLEQLDESCEIIKHPPEKLQVFAISTFCVCSTPNLSGHLRKRLKSSLIIPAPKEQ